jgi:hypothetical protein
MGETDGNRACFTHHNAVHIVLIASQSSTELAMPRTPARRKIIVLDDGRKLWPLDDEAASCGIHRRTAKRANLPETYVGGVLYTVQGSFAAKAAAGLRTRNEPPKRRRAAGARP